jgi:hypothetical protein
MDATTLSAPGGTRRGGGLLISGLVAGVVALAVVGAVLAVGILRGPSEPVAAVPSGPFTVGQDVPTSFGAMAVEFVEKIDGLTAKDVAGATHGVSGFVPKGQAQVQAAIALTNLSGEVVPYDPRMFRLLVGEKGKPLSEVQATFRPGTLQPAAAVKGQLKFVVPADSKVVLAFDDPGRDKPLLIDLGKTGGETPDSAFNDFRHKPDGH